MNIRLQKSTGEEVITTTTPLDWKVLPDGIYYNDKFYSRIAVNNSRAIFREGSTAQLGKDAPALAD